MKNQIITFGALMALSFGANAQTQSMRPDFKTHMSAISAQMKNSGTRQWRNATLDAPAQKGFKAAPQPSKVVGPMSYWGTVFTPSGEEWIYSCDYTYVNLGTADMGWETHSISEAVITIYDSDLKKYGSFTAKLELGEHETSINSVQVNPTLTRKFFNIDDSYEVMVYIHATTDDYTGHAYTQVYSLSNGQLIDTFEGDNIAEVNTTTSSWEENFTLVFMREDVEITEESYDYHILFDVYGKAGWASGATLKHTFDINYALVAGAGEYALPILVNTYNNEIYYALPSYEKPYFESDWSDDITPDNHFVIDLYNSKFELVKSTKIPMQLEDNSLFSFPGMGELNGFNDLAFDANGEPVYTVGIENYHHESDDFTTSMYVYDSEGNRTNTLFTDAADYLRLSDVEGYDQQFCVYHPDDNGGYFDFVDMPSGDVKATIPIMLASSNISTSIDRIAANGSYQYISSLANGTVDADENVIHRLAWFDADGSFDRFDSINLGKDIVMALPYVSSEALNPYLFDTSDGYEYMFLVKKLISKDSSRSKECLRIYTQDSECLLDLEPIEETGQYLSSIFLHNPDSDNPKLVVTYTDGENSMFHIYDLPLSKFSNGDGTPESPYIITNAGEFRAIQQAPSAHYQLANDIDFRDLPWEGSRCTFTGTLDGKGYTLRNLNLIGHGIFGSISDGGSVKDLKINGLKMKASGPSGILAVYVSGSDDDGSSVSNVHISNAVVTSAGEMDFGGIAGEINLRSKISDCSVTHTEIIGDAKGYAAGIVGRMGTGSTVSNCLFEGKIYALMAGGIVGETSLGDETIQDCHVNADITGINVAGGIVGYSSRSTVTHCLVEGTVQAIGTKTAYAGGIVGELKSNYAKEHPIIIRDNIVAAKISVPQSSQNAIAHRIAGFTSGDEMLVDWESKDPNVDWSDPSTYPYVHGDKEVGMSYNYALGIAIIDSTVDDSPESAEGKSIENTELDEAFLSGHNWITGNDAEHPWHIGGKALLLYYETLSVISSEDKIRLDAEDITSCTVTFSCTGRYADLIEIACSDPSIATITSIEVSDDLYTVTCTVEYVNAGTCEITASIGDSISVCEVLAQASSIAEVEATEHNLIYDGKNLYSQNAEITVYSTAGIKMASGASIIDVTSLPKGIYIAVSGNYVLKFSK